MKNCFVDLATRSIADLVPAAEMGLGSGYIITRINVPAEFRGKGHGDKLLKAILKTADEEQVTLWLELASSGPLDNDALATWYEKHGFKWHNRYGVMRRLPGRSLT